MSLDTTDTGFEALRGTMLTDAGMDGLQEFTRTRPTHMVIEEAFMPGCGDMIRRVKNLPQEDRSAESLQVRNLVTCLGHVAKDGIEEALWTQALWQDRSPTMEPHVDFRQGNTVLGFFWVFGEPTFDIYATASDELHAWKGMSPQITRKVPISPENPLSVPMRSRQMVLLNGAAVAGEQDVNGQVSSGQASLPHAANVLRPRDRRSRLMVFGANFKATRKQLPGSD